MAMAKDLTRKLSIRLLRDGLSPAESLRSEMDLKDWPRIPGARIALGSLGGDTPEWATFLELTDEEKQGLHNELTYALLFLEVGGRWFCMSFGMGHVKLNLGSCENNFGLRVALNEVDPEELKSMDVRTPDSNTLMRRSQSSRGTDQSVFGIDVHQDILRILAGKAKDTTFAKRLAGADGLTLHRKAALTDLPHICAEAYGKSQEQTYKQHFGWIDQIAHVRDEALVIELESRLAAAMTEALTDDVSHSLHLAFPEIYDPEQTNEIRYRGFRSRMQYFDLELSGYLEALRERGIVEYSEHYLRKHRVHEVDGLGRDSGKHWKVGDCIGCELSIEDRLYVLSGGKWYEIDVELARQVEKAFQRLPQVEMPRALTEEHEPDYNKRMGKVGMDFLCLDRKNVRAAGAATPIEICDLLGPSKELIHVKNGSAASRLSHLFEQGRVAARVLKMDGRARDEIRHKISEVQDENGKTGFESVIPGSVDSFEARKFTIIFAVMRKSMTRKLSFFSLLALSRAEEEVRALGYRCAFAWVDRG